MKIKKLISLVSALTVAMPLVTLPVKADVDFTWHMDESAANSDANSGPAETDFAGKGNGYTYAFTGNKTHIWLTSSFADSSKRLSLPENYTSYEGYMLISMNVYSPAGQQFQFQVKDSYPITPNVTVTTANGFNINKWNKVFAVVKLSATQSNRTGYYYINGEKKSWTSNSHYLFNDATTFNTIRLRTQKDNTPLYVDDVHVSFTKDALTDDQLVELAAMPTLTAPSGNTVTVGSVDKVTGTVSVAVGTTLAELQSKNTNTLTAYTDSTFETPAESNTALESGNVIIATDQLGKMSYFNVEVVGEDYTWWHMDESAVNGGANSAPAVNDFAGKGSGSTYGFTGNATWFTLTNSFADESKKLTIPDDPLAYEGYMLISMNVYSPQGQQFVFRTDYDDQPAISPNVTVTTENGFDIDRWNKVFTVVKLSAERNNRTGYYYINGVKKDWKANGHYLFNSANQEKIHLRTLKDNKPLYVDDLYVTFVPGELTDSQLEALAAMPALSETSETDISGNTVNVTENTKLSDLQEENTNILTAYTDSTFTTPLGSDAALAEGNIVIATDSFGKMSYYDVNINDTEIPENPTGTPESPTGTPEGDTVYFDDERTVDYSAKFTAGYTYSYADKAEDYLFTVIDDSDPDYGETFSLLDVKDDTSSKYFVITRKAYAKLNAVVTSDNANYFDPSIDTDNGTPYESVAKRYYRSPIFLLNDGDNFKKAYYMSGFNDVPVRLSDAVRSHIDTSHVWNCEPAPNAHIPNEQYSFTAGIALPSASEIRTYADRFLVAEDSALATETGNWRYIFTRTMLNNSGDNRLVGYVKGDNKLLGQPITNSDIKPYIRPCFWLNDSFFANVKIDLATAGAAVKQEIKKQPVAALKDIYSREELINVLGFSEDDIPEDPTEPPEDTVFFDDERTVDYSAKYTSGKKYTYANNAEKYVFTVIDDNDPDYGETFSLLDVKDDTSSKYFVLARKAYVKLPVKTSDNANYFDPGIETNNGTEYSSLAERHYGSPIFFLNDGDYLKNAWDSMTKLNDVPIRLSDTIRSHIDNSHVWNCEPAPNAHIANEQYTFTAGIALPSASEIETYADRFLVEEDSALATETGNWRYIFTRTMLNNSGTKRYIGYVKGTNELKGQDISDKAVFPYIRPCFWLDDSFFANVKVDLATAGAAVKQEIKKLGYDSLKDTYSMDELSALGVEIPDNTFTLAANVRNGGEAEYGKTLELECNYYSSSGYKPDSVEINWKRRTGNSVVTVGQDATYVISEADADTGTSKIYCEITYTDENGSKKTERSNEFTIPSLGVESVKPNQEWAMSANADETNKFTVDGKSFTLIDTFDNDKSTFFVTTNDNYGTHQVTSAYMNAEDDESYAHWMNTSFRLSGNLVGEDYVTLPENILSYIDYGHIWLTEGAPDSPAASKHEEMLENYSFEAGLAPLSASELKRYREVIGSTENIGDTGKFNTRTAANWTNESKPDVEYMLVSESKNEGTKVKMNHWALPSGTYIRPAFYLTKDFFKNVEISFDDLGENVIEAMKNIYYIEDLEDIYDSDNLEDAGFVSRPEDPEIESETLLDLGGSVQIIYSEISDYTGNEIPIFAVYNENDALDSVIYGQEGCGQIDLEPGQKARAMLWDDNYTPLGEMIEVKYGEPLNTANTASITSSERGNNFTKGENAFIYVKTNGEFFSYKIKDLGGNVVKENGNVAQIKVYQPIDVSSLDTGYYEISIYSTPTSQNPIATTSLSMLDAHVFSAAATSPFGMNLHSARPQNGWHYGLVKECYSIGAMTVRDGYYWADTEKTKGVYKYSFPCADLINNRNMDYIITTGFNNPLYDDGKTPYTNAGRTGFANYSKALYDLYPETKGTLTNMEVFNEFWGPKGKLNNSPANSQHNYYYQIAKKVYETVKPAHPDAVLFGEFGTTEWNQNIVNDGIVNYMDAAAIHLYPGGPNANDVRTDIPENSNMATKYNNAKSLIEGKGKTAKIWVTETGMNTATNGYYNFTELEQAIFLPRTHFQLLALGAEKVLWYDLLDEGTGDTHEDHYGLLRAKGSAYGAYTPKPAYVAYGVMTRALDGTSYKNMSKSGTKYCYTFEGNGKKVSCVYDAKSTSKATVTASSAFSITNFLGHTDTLPAGTYELDIAGTVLYLTGDVKVSF